MVPFDPLLREAIQQQSSVVLTKPVSPSAKAINALAKASLNWSMPSGANGYLQFFIERLVQSGIR
jgi:flagellar biosynthesis protein FlhG